MGINAAGLELVKGFEGLYLKAYKCPAGVWTIGWGHTGKVDGKTIGSGMTITKAKAEELLKADMNTFWKAVNDPDQLHLCKSMSQNQLSALCSLAFNVGSNWLPVISQLRDAQGKFIRWRTIEEVGDALLLYTKQNGQHSAGLLERRKAERELFFTGFKRTANVVPLPTLRRGDEGQAVEAMQKLLNTSGASHLFKPLDVDGKFGQKSEEALRLAQEAYNISVDGACGKQSWDVLLTG